MINRRKLKRYWTAVNKFAIDVLTHTIKQERPDYITPIPSFDSYTMAPTVGSPELSNEQLEGLAMAMAVMFDGMKTIQAGNSANLPIDDCRPYGVCYVQSASGRRYTRILGGYIGDVERLISTGSDGIKGHGGFVFYNLRKSVDFGGENPANIPLSRTNRIFYFDKEQSEFVHDKMSEYRKALAI